MADSTEFLKQQLYTLRQTVGYLRERAATVGGEVFLPLGDCHALHQARAEIAGCKAELRTRGVEVDDEPEDVPPPAAQGGPSEQSPPVPQIVVTNSGSAGNLGMEGVVYGSVAIYNTNTTAGQLGANGVFQLRAPVPDFVGRDAELERLVAALRPSQGSRAAAISGVRGMGGLGKTELAYAAAAQLAGDYPDGQILLELAGASATPLSPAQALQQVIRAFRPEDKLPEDLPALQLLYRSALGGRKVLMLADDARDAAQVRPLLPPTGCALLVTSRQRFILDGMIPIDLERLEEGAAVALLRGICDRLTEEQAQQLARLCGHLPLALRVSAGILLNDPALSPERYLARLKAQPLAELRDPDDPARDVGAILRLSYANLEASAQTVFRRLGVLAADADLELIAALLELSEDKADDVLRTLLRRSLVEYDEVRQRWGLHDLVRACALTLLIEAGEERATRLRSAEQVIALIEQADRHYQARGEGVLSGLALFDRERAHLEAVRLWLWAQPSAADIDALVIQEAGAALFIGELRDPLRTVRVPQLERALAAAQRQGNRVAEGWLLGNLGSVYQSLGEVRRAIELYEQDFTAAQELGDRAKEGRALGKLGNAYSNLGEGHRAIELYEQALAVAQELGDHHGEGWALGNLGVAYSNLGDVRRAIELYEHALAIARALGDWFGEGRMLSNLGNILADLGEVRQAIELYEQALAIARALGDHQGEGRALGNLGNTYQSLGEVRRAIELYEQALAIAHELGYRHGEGRALDNLANALAYLGRMAEANNYYVQALAVHHELDDRLALAHTYWAYGLFLIDQDDRERGLALLETSVVYELQMSSAQAVEHAALVERLRLGA